MISKFRVRFVGGDKQPPSAVDKTEFERPQMLDYPNRRRKSQFACLECKKRHLKCDETFPVCLRCKRRGVACRSAIRSARWQLEVPGLTIKSQLSTISSYANHRQLQYWMEKASQVMVIDPNINPFSFGILKYFESSPSLICAVQSLSVAHEHFFSPSSLEKVWEEQGKALSLVQKELQESSQPAHGSLLAVLLIGLCTAWVYHKTDDEFGQQHLHGARAMLDVLLAEPGSEEDPFIQQALATYLGWDQAVAFLLPPSDQISLESEDLLRCVRRMRNQYNPTIGYAIEIIYLLGKVGRYCRAIIGGGLRDIETEAYFEEQLLQFAPVGKDPTSHLVDDSFRKHGLIMLYRAIESASASALEGLSLDSNAFILGGHELSLDGEEFSLDSDGFALEDDGFVLDDNNLSFDGCYHPNVDVIKQYAKDIIQNLNNIPDGSRCHSLLSLPLFCAASELTQTDCAEKQDVREWFRNLLSLTRLPVNLCALELLEQLWDMDNNGHKVFWLSYVYQNSLIFTLC